MKKIVLAGPPHSGKSCLREGLKQALRAIPGAPYPYVITACPDGEGSWFQETVTKDPELARQCKAAYKGKFTPEFVRRVADSVSKCGLPLTLVDIGGIPSPENATMCASATHIVLLAGDMSRLEEWRAFAARLGLVIIAEIHSAYEAKEDIVEPLNGSGVLKGQVHALERGVPLADRPMVRALANHIAGLCSSSTEVP